MILLTYLLTYLLNSLSYIYMILVKKP